MQPMKRADSDFRYLGDPDCDLAASLLADVDVADVIYVSARPDWTYEIDNEGELVRDGDGLPVILGVSESIRLTFQCRIDGRLGMVDVSVPRALLNDADRIQTAALLKDLAGRGVQNLRRHAA